MVEQFRAEYVSPLLSTIQMKYHRSNGPNIVFFSEHLRTCGLVDSDNHRVRCFPVFPSSVRRFTTGGPTGS